MKRKNEGQNRGITLIALIITIIILLILAGVAINMVLGQNGILNNSKEATQKYKESQENEELSLILTNYYMAKLEDDNTDLATYLNKNNATLKGEKDGSYIIEYNGNEYTIEKDNLDSKREEQKVIVTENGEEKIITVADMAKEPKKYYGAKVTNYTKGGTYRIFYVDTAGKYGDGINTVYLIADYDENRQTSLGTYASSKDYAAYVYDASKTKIRQMNPMWSNYIGNLEEISWEENAKSAAYLCDTSKWESYCDNTKANYAIGGPSLEMYVDSYNQTHNANSLVYTCNTSTNGTYSTNNGKGYFVGADGSYANNGWYTNNNIIDTEQNEIYMKSNKNTWIASPSPDTTHNVSNVNGSGAYINCGARLHLSYGMCPLVSLKSDTEIKIEI